MISCFQAAKCCAHFRECWAKFIGELGVLRVWANGSAPPSINRLRSAKRTKDLAPPLTFAVFYFFFFVAVVATPESTAGKAIAGCRGSRRRKRGSRRRTFLNDWVTCAWENWCLTMSTGVSVPWSLAIKRTMCTKCTRE